MILLYEFTVTSPAFSSAGQNRDFYRSLKNLIRFQMTVSTTERESGTVEYSRAYVVRYAKLPPYHGVLPATQRSLCSRAVGASFPSLSGKRTT